MSADKRIWLEIMLLEEHCLSISTKSPSVSASVTFLAFFVIGAIPLIPYIEQPLEMSQQFSMSAFLAGTMFFLIGMLKSLALAKAVFLS